MSSLPEPKLESVKLKKHISPHRNPPRQCLALFLVFIRVITSCLCTHPLYSLASAYVWKNGCESVPSQRHLTEAECREYMDQYGLTPNNPFAGSWPTDCRKCMRGGSGVAYNNHPDPACTTSWHTVCAREGQAHTRVCVCVCVCMHACMACKFANSGKPLMPNIQITEFNSHNDGCANFNNLNNYSNCNNYRS